MFRKALVEDWLRAAKFATNALAVWESHPRYDTYWRDRDATRNYRRIGAPSVHIGGWWDIFAQPTIDAWAGYQRHGTRDARGRAELITGPGHLWGSFGQGR